MSIYLRPDSRFWWMLLEADGSRASTKIPREGGSPVQNRELKRQAIEVYTKAQAAAVLVTKSPQAQTIGFRAWSVYYSDHVIAHHRGADKERSMLAQLERAFGHCHSLAAIDEEAVRAWMTTRALTVAKSTVNRELDLLKSMLRAAVPKYLPAYPLGHLRAFRVVEKEPRVLTEDEEARILAVCNPHDRAFVILALDTLLRLSSVVRLEWPQVKFAQRTILPLNAKVTTDAKPMSSRLYEALDAIQQPKGHVFAHFYAGGPTAARIHAIRRFAYLCELAHVPHGRAKEGVTFHCLRHTGATRALQRGASLRTVMKLGGWTQVATVLRYLHTADADVIAAAESIGNHVRAK